MPITWSMLRNPQPTTLAAARALAHRAAQWSARAARANLEPAADDSHSALAWDPARAALLSQPLKGGTQVGLRIGVLEVIVAKGAKTEAMPLATNTDAEVAAWLDGKLADAGLQPASGAALPYDMPATNFARAVDEGPRLAALAGWFAAGAEILEELRRKYKRFKPGPSPVRCWPHHFDIAILVGLEEGGAGDARAIGIGLSPGDDYYAQPYFYLSPYPKPDTANLPPLPPGGRWHTREFFGAVATGVEMLALDDPRGGIMAVVDAAFTESLKRLGCQAG
jgi:hypothetical protein